MSWMLGAVPDHLKVREMCKKAVQEDLCLLEYVPDWFVSNQQINIWHDNNSHCDDDRLIEWYVANKKRKAQKSSIKEELLPIPWHPS